MAGSVRRAKAASDGQPGRGVIARALLETYAGPAWHGPSLRAALHGIGAEEAARRSAPGRNTIWELVLHLAYGRYLGLRRLEEGASGQFPRRLTKAWWPAAPAAPTEAAWRADLELLAEYQARLLAALERATEARLRVVRPSQRHTIGQELLGLALHDAYHAGQIRLLVRLGASG